MGAKINYLDFAEEDYEFFRTAYDNNNKRNVLAWLGQSICERYLKHIISEYANTEEEFEELKKENMLKTHNLHRLLNYINVEMGIKIPEDLSIKLERIDGYYFTTRYPGDDSFIATDEDIEKANIAIEAARAFILEKCKEIDDLEQEGLENDDHDDR